MPRAGGVLIGIDTEWGDDDRGCALVQIATVDTVFLIDLMTLHHQPRTNDDEEDGAALLTLLRWLMAESHLTKIGFSFSHDWEQLDIIAPGLSQEAKNVMDLQTYIGSEALVEDCGNLVGLSKVVKHYFGIPLDKTEQCSAWCSRPLTKSQIRYAALDALILVDIVSVLCVNIEAF